MDAVLARWGEPDGTETLEHAHRVEIEESLRYHAARPGEIAARLAELDAEWDIERALAAAAAALSLSGLVLAGAVDRRFLLLPAAAAGFLLQHASGGWCPPVPLLRRFGFRTHAEVCRERCGLGMLLGGGRPLAEPAPAAFVRLGEAVSA